MNGITYRYSILKCDIDLKLSKTWLNYWKISRKALLEGLDFHVKKIIIKPSSKRGYHAWIHIGYIRRKELSSDDINRLQYLVDGETGRALINSWRIGRGIKGWNKIFDHTIWRSNHKCDCRLHQKILKRIKTGQKRFKGI